jgi:hypothetical protein
MESISTDDLLNLNEFERLHAPQGGVSSNHELLYFPLYLGNNLELDWEMAKRYAGDIAG